MTSSFAPGMLEIDGSSGEGGGQILRTSLSLSAITGKPFKMINIRKKRNRPGLLAQHLVCVKAAAEVCNAEVEGDRKGSEELFFLPGLIRSGSYRFAVGTAGSAMLVFQTLFPMLSAAGGESELDLSGGTHNPFAPPFEFVDRVFLPAVEDLGFRAEMELVRHGFYPQGGGIMRSRVLPRREAAEMDLTARGTLREMRPIVLIAGLASEIGQREARVLGRELKRSSLPADVRRLEPGEGPGNAVLLEAGYGRARCLFSAFGRKGKRAESVAHEAVKAWRAHHKLEVPVQPELADQLLLPMALAGAGCFRTGPLTAHSRTNMLVIERFLDKSFKTARSKGGVTRVEI
jgi:RNA 3'-terminal phosphate cyclase (ATP)